MDFQDWATVAIVTLAAYGAILSTYNLLAARGDRARTLKVALTWGMAPPCQDS